MSDHITKIRKALEATSDGDYLLPGCSVKMFRSLLAALDEAMKQRDAYREALDQLAAQSSGVVCSTSKADCMAAWAQAAIAAQETHPADGGGQSGGKSQFVEPKCLSQNDISVVDGGAGQGQQEGEQDG